MQAIFEPMKKAWGMTVAPMILFDATDRKECVSGEARR
jgi:hypothetical protein